MFGPQSGKYGVINGVSTVRNWTVNDSATNPKFVASNTAGGTGRRIGIQDWTGNFNTYGSVPVIMPGEYLSFIGYVAPQDGVGGSVGPRYFGNAIIDSVAITWNWATGDIIAAAYNFSGNGELQNADGGAYLADETEPTVPTVNGTKIQYSADGEAFTELGNIVQAVLTLSAANPSYVNSSTAGWTKRQPGPIDWSLAISQEEIQRSSTILKGSDYVWKIFDGDTTFWELTWGKVLDFSGITVDTETGGIVARTVNVEMNGSVGGVLGSIVLPGAAENWWPVEIEEEV